MKTGVVDEMRLPDGSIRAHYAQVAAWLSSLSRADLIRSQKEAEAIFTNVKVVRAEVRGDREALEISIDPKAKLPLGEYARGGKNSDRRRREGREGLGS